jgi:hypothetical protein
MTKENSWTTRRRKETRNDPNCYCAGHPCRFGSDADRRPDGHCGRGGRESGVLQRCGTAGPAGPHSRRADACHHHAGNVQHARGRCHPEHAGGVSARQSVEPGRRQLAAAPEFSRHHRLDRRGQAVALQPGHELHPRAARSTSRARRDRGLSGRVGRRPVPCAGPGADRGLAGLHDPRQPLPGLDPGRHPTRSREPGRRPARDRARPGEPVAVRVLCHEENGSRLDGHAGVPVRLEDESTAPGRLDVGRRGGLADLSSRRPLSGFRVSERRGDVVPFTAPCFGPCPGSSVALVP